MHNAHADTNTDARQTERYPKSYIVWLIGGIVLFIPSLIVAHSHLLVGLQARIFYDLNNVSLPHVFVTLAIWLTEALGAGYPIAACVIIPLLFKRFRLAWRFLVVAGGSTVAFYLIKKIINEPRPVVMLHSHLHQRVIETGPGFPSGHETAATALALTLWLILPNKWRWLSVLWIILVALSRIYLGVHAPVDIIGGFAGGLVTVCVIRLLPPNVAKPLRLDHADSLLDHDK